MKLFFDPSRIVLSGVGMDHDELVRLAQEYFVDKKPIWEQQPELVMKGKERDNSIAQYTGGIITVRISCYSRDSIHDFKITKCRSC